MSVMCFQTTEKTKRYPKIKVVKLRLNKYKKASITNYLYIYNIKNNYTVIKNSRSYEIHDEIHSSCLLDKYHNIHFFEYCE